MRMRYSSLPHISGVSSRWKWCSPRSGIASMQRSGRSCKRPSWKKSVRLISPDRVAKPALKSSADLPKPRHVHAAREDSEVERCAVAKHEYQVAWNCGRRDRCNRNIVSTFRTYLWNGEKRGVRYDFHPKLRRRLGTLQCTFAGAAAAKFFDPCNALSY